MFDVMTVIIDNQHENTSMSDLAVSTDFSTLQVHLSPLGTPPKWQNCQNQISGSLHYNNYCDMGAETCICGPGKYIMDHCGRPSYFVFLLDLLLYAAVYFNAILSFSSFSS